MPRSAIVMTCVLLASSLLFPGAAVAKGGNGSHPVVTPAASKHGVAKAEKSKAKKPDVGKQTAKPKAASPKKPKAASPKKTKAAAAPKQGTTTKRVAKTARKAPKTEKVKKQKSPAQEEPTLVDSPATAVASSFSSEGLDDGRISSDTVGATGLQTRGVLDTIRLKVSESLKSMSATVAGMWSAAATWFTD